MAFDPCRGGDPAPVKTRPYTLEEVRPTQLGLIVLQTDETIERDFRVLMPKDVELLVSRVPSGAEVTPETLRSMEGHLTGAASLLPEAAVLAAIGYGCTSGTSQIGAGRVAELIRAGAATAHVTEPVSALLAACRHLGVRRLGIVSPYEARVSARLCEVLEENGVTVGAFASFDEAEEARVARISGASIVAAVTEEADLDGMDAVFLSCTNLRAVDRVGEIEDRIDLPVLTSNQVLAWHMLRLAGKEPGADVVGRLWQG